MHIAPVIKDIEQPGSEPGYRITKTNYNNHVVLNTDKEKGRNNYEQNCRH
jgi:hypothetical protein